MSIHVIYTAEPGETNDVTITKPTNLSFRIEDPGADIAAGAGCSATASPHVVHCDTDFGFRDSLQLDTGDGNDHATFSSFNFVDATGGSGDDVLTIGSGVCSRRLKGGSGNDTLNADGSPGPCGTSAELDGEGGNDTLNGTSSTDTLRGGEGDDILNGLGWIDALDGGLGADAINGGDGEDTVKYADRTVGVTVDLDGAAGDDGEPGEGDTVGSDVENAEGGSGNDTLRGNPAVNMLRGGLGNDLLDGGDGSDRLLGDAGSDTEFGGPGNEIFEGVYDGGDDTWYGGEGDDVFAASSGNGADTIVGGPGEDRATYEYAIGAVVVSLDGAPGDGVAGENDNVGSDIEYVVSGGGNDTLIGSDGDNFLDGGNGSDTIHGAGGDDVLNPGFTGFESNVLNGGSGADTADYSRLFQVTVSLDGVANDGQSGSSDNVGIDVEGIIGGGYNDVLTGNDGPNVIDGGGGADLISGLAGADELVGGFDLDTVEGGEGDDTLTGGAGPDVLRGGPGSDTTSYAAHSSWVVVDLAAGTTEEENGSVDTLSDIENATGTASVDILTGDAATNRLAAGDGDDVVAGGLGADLLIGGAGSDVADYSERGGDLNVDLEDEGDDGQAGENDTLREFEGIWGGDGDDNLRGTTGDETFDGGLGKDVIAGGPGFDLVDYSDRSTDVVADLDGAVGDDGEDGEGDTLSELEGIVGGAGDDELEGDQNANELDGGAGNDLLSGGLGADELVGGPGFDGVDYSAHSSGVTVDIDGGAGDDGALGEGDTVDESIEALFGGAGGDQLTGDGRDNPLFGGPGSDTLAGRGGDDLLNGGSGADLLIGDAGFDLADYSERSAGVIATLNGLADDGEPGEGDVIAVDVEDLRGGAGNDTLVGDGQENFIFGLGGNDSLDGGFRSDLLDGGDGDDNLASRDSMVDENDCGEGADGAVMDWIDDAVDCEQTLGPTPVVSTGAASLVSTTSARLSGAVTANGAPSTAWIELGTTTSYGRQSPVTNVAAGAIGAAVTAILDGLMAGTTYHYRVVGRNAGGTTYGQDRTFTTTAAVVLPPPPPPPPVRCVVAKVVGQPLRVARGRITRGRCRVGKITRRASRVVRKGIVLAQRPRAGRRLPRGSRVSLVVSSGKPRTRGTRR